MATMDEWNSIGSSKRNVMSPKIVNRAPGIGEGVDEYLEPLLNKVLMTKSFGINLGAIELCQVAASCPEGKGDRFRISIPYANHKLEWIVMFNSICPDEGPDFEFSDRSFLADPALHTLEKFVPSLYNWNHLEPDALLAVITELVAHYKKHQIDQLNQFSDRLNVEYKTMISGTDINEDDVELILLPDSVQPEEAHFLIRLAIDFSKLPGKHPFLNNDAAMLLVTFQGAHWNRITPNLYFSKNVKETFSNSTSLHLPSFPSEKTLVDYVPEVKKLINSKIDTIATNFEKKRTFIAAVLILQGPSVLEYDCVEFNYISLMLVHRDFYFILHFNLPPTFPWTPPRISLQSIYHMTSKTELFKQGIANNCPYSPRWQPDYMFTQALRHVITVEINKFKNASTKNRR